MSQVDWSNAPEGATHYSEQVPGHSCAAFWREQDGRLVEFWGVYSAGKFTHLANPRGYAKLPSDCIPRPPTSWSGEGWAPVGQDCEAYDAEEEKWQAGRVLMRGNTDHAFASGSPAGWNKLFWACQFRPIRTPEQIAADEREAAVTAMLDHFRLGSDKQELLRAVCFALHDAGYRKQPDTK